MLLGAATGKPLFSWSQCARLAARVCALLAAGLVSAGLAFAQHPNPDGFADLAERLMPAVVNIQTSQTIDREAVEPMPGLAPASPLAPAPKSVSSLGSGFIIDPQGVIVTNNHVIDGADEIEVVLHNGVRLKASLVGRDPATDIAVLRVKPGVPLVAVPFGPSSRTRVGAWVLAIGNPFGFGGSVSVGIISARNRDIDQGRYDDFIQTDAAINRGNSGGPLFNMRGEVIGVNTAIVSPTGQSVGVGFAAPADLVSNVVQQLLQFGETRRGWIGVRVQPPTPELAQSAGLTGTRGAIITSLSANGPAAKAGLRRGDLLVSIDGRVVEESRLFSRMVAETPIGKTVKVEFLRAGKRQSVAVLVARLDEGSAASLGGPQPGTAPAAQTRLLGLTLSELTPPLRRRFSIRDDVEGLVVLGVDPATDAASKLRVGDVLVEMAFAPVREIADAEVLANRASKKPERPVLLHIWRAGEMSFRSVRQKR